MKELSTGNAAFYPKIKQIKENSYYQGLLQNLYAGPDGEMLLFLQFSYQNFLLSPFGNEYANVFAKFAEDDLYHSKQLAQLITMFGGDPVFCNAQGKWLGGRNVDYLKSLKQMIQVNIESKEKMVIDYKTTMLKIEDTLVNKTLKQILSDEEEHLVELKAILRKINSDCEKK